MKHSNFANDFPLTMHQLFGLYWTVLIGITWYWMVLNVSFGWCWIQKSRNRGNEEFGPLP